MPFRSEILYGNSQFSILTDSDGRTFGRKELMIGNRKRGIEYSIVFTISSDGSASNPLASKSIDIDSGQCSRHFLLHDISKVYFFKFRQEYSSIHLAAIEIPVISLLFETETIL